MKRTASAQKLIKKEKRESILKAAVLKKASGLIALLLMASMLVPLLAFAGIGAVTYQGGWVNGVVYKAGGDPSETITIKLPNGKVIEVEPDSVKTVKGVTYYTFSANVGTYTYVRVVDIEDPSVFKDVYHSVNQLPGGGDGGSTDPGAPVDGIVGNDGKVDAAKLAELLKNNPNASIKIPGTFVLLPASAFGNGQTLTIVDANGASYVLPLAKMDLEAIAKLVGVNVNDLVIRVDIAKLSGDAAKAVADAAQSLGGQQVGDAYDFKLSALDKDGKAVEINLGNVYIKRTIPLPNAVDSNKATGVVFDSGKLSFVPSTFNGNTATLQRPGHSVYAVITLDKSLEDVAGHWAKEYIDLLTNKLIVEGTTDTTFEPERSITRAEFAALVVRALGLLPQGSSSFSDVKSSDWFSGVVGAAAEAGIVDGYEDGTFRPNNVITREELSAMVVRALKFAGYDTSVTAAEQAELLGKFTDANKIVWGHAEVAAAIKSGIVEGMTDTTISPDTNATRAQSATMLKRFLSAVDFI